MNTKTGSSHQSRQGVRRVSDANSEFSKNSPGVLASLGLAALLFGATSAFAQTAPTLGRVQSFGVLGGSAVTAAGAATIGGDVGSSPTPTVTGFPPAGVTAGFTLYTAANAVTAGARTDAGAAFASLAGQGCTVAVPADLSLLPQPLAPGVYCMGAGGLTGTITLSGPANAVWIFKTASSLTTAGASNIVMAGGGNSCNVFWQVGTSATLGAASTFRGNIFAGVSIGLGTTSHVIGRVIAGTGAVTLDGGNAVDGCASVGAGLAATSVSTLASSPSVAIGTPMTDTATLTGGGVGSAAPTGTMTFNLYSDASCTVLVFSTTTAVAGAGSYTSAPFTPTVAGIYHWIASYSGDLNNAPTAGTCGAAGENVIVAATLGGSGTPVPTLSEWAMILLAGLLAIAGIVAMRRQAR